jgi:phosphoribosyl 1,2-cyclic phosphodiesterase
MVPSMTVRFWGVRGSIASPGRATVRYGGNTPCVSIELPQNRVLVLDAGTGIRELGKSLLASPVDIYILLTHAHWDHIQGFPFFAPIYQPHRQIYILEAEPGKLMLNALIEQMDAAHFPVQPDQLACHCQYITDDPIAFLGDRGMQVARIGTNHPGGSWAYRVTQDDRSVIYMTDNELDPPSGQVTAFARLAEFCRHAQVLIHDAQYVAQDMPQKRGWGHSLVSQALTLAVAAEVQHLVLYHHDPDRSDDALDSIQEDARAWFRDHGHATACTVAYEGLALDV